MAAQHLSLVEKSLLRGQWDLQISEPYTSATSLAKLVVECRFKDALESETARAVFKPVTGDTDRPFEEFFNLSKNQGSQTIEEELGRLTLTIACLHAFIQANWTGPDLDIQPLDLIADESEISSIWTAENLHSKAVSELAYGGEPAYHLAQVPAFLRLSQLLVALPYTHLQSISWWRLRVANVHQRILDEPVSPPEDFHDLLQSFTAGLANEPDLAGRLNLELGLLEHTLGQDKSAGEDFVKAGRATGLEYKLTGALGKRTKFQQKELSQLVLLAESHLGDTQSSPERENKQLILAQDANTNIPETLALNDDTLLEQTVFTSSNPAEEGSRLSHIDPSAQPPLHPLDQCILLSLCLNVRNTQASHGLTAEQMAPYVARVISHPRNWSVHSMALLLRSRLESNRTRTVERSTLQLQALIDQMPTDDSSTSERLLYFHVIPLPSRWDMQKELADRFLSIGVVKSALEIFERLEMWEEVVKCYGALETPDRGIAIVRDLLEGRKAEANAVIERGKSNTSAPRKKTQDATREAKLWCLLGDLDLANAQTHYERAWTLSGGTSGRAMRSLGGYLFARGKWAEAAECLSRAVKINPLLTRSWFILGCAYMRLEDWTAARDAFARCVAIDEEDGESWNNLASMYLRIGAPKKATVAADKDAEDELASELVSMNVNTDSIPFENKLLAFRALKQGLRYAYENWRMWANYTIVAMDVGELAEACRAQGRVVEQTGGKLGLDVDVIDRLVNAVTRAHPDPEVAAEADDNAVHNPNEGHGLYRNVLGLFERVLLPRVSSARVFRAYARLLSWAKRWDESIKAHMDAYRAGAAASLSKGDIPDPETWEEAVGEVQDIVDVLRNFGPKVEGNKWRAQARSIVRSFMGRMKGVMEGEKGWEQLEELSEELKREED